MDYQEVQALPGWTQWIAAWPAWCPPTRQPAIRECAARLEKRMDELETIVKRAPAPVAAPVAAPSPQSAAAPAVPAPRPGARARPEPVAAASDD